MFASFDQIYAEEEQQQQQQPAVRLVPRGRRDYGSRTQQAQELLTFAPLDVPMHEDTQPQQVAMNGGAAAGEWYGWRKGVAALKIMKNR